MTTIPRPASSSRTDPRDAGDREQPTRARALRIAAWYAILSGLWIAISGRVLHQLVRDPARAVLLEDVKGWVFVLVTAGLLSLMLDRQFHRIRQWGRRIRESDATLLVVEDNLPGSYVYQFVREEGRKPYFAHVSASVERVHGVSAGEILRDRNRLFEQIDPAQRAALKQAYDESARTLGDFDVEVRMRRADGQDRLVRLRARPRRDGDGRIHWDGFATDVTERKAAETALRQSEENFRAMFEVASIGMAQADPLTGQWTRVNRKLCEITGYSEAELCGLRVSQITHPDDRARGRTLFQQLVRGDAPDYHFEKRYIRRDGSVAWVNVNMAVIRDVDGRALRTMATIEDITERKHLEVQLLQAQKMEAIGQLAGGVAHDFNNILAAMLMQADVASMTPNLPGEVAEGLREMKGAVERAAALTRQLLLFSRKQVMQPRDLDLNDIVTSLARMLQRIIGEDVRLQLHLHPAPLTIHADAAMMDQILMNLAVNARDAMTEGGCLLIETAETMIDEETARLQADASPGRYVTLRVTDSGSGISPEVLPRIFEPFFTTKEPGKGTGLGLATVFGIARQHRGWIDVESQPGKGTTFQIFLPAIAAPAGGPETAHSEPRGGSETILLVEDDRAVRAVTRTVLERGGYHVLEATSGADALAIWERQRPRIALLLTDLVMPGGIGGQELARRFQESEPGLKVIYTSGYSPEFAGGGTQLEHGENFVQKPASPDQLLAAVRWSLDS